MQLPEVTECEEHERDEEEDVGKGKGLGLGELGSHGCSTSRIQILVIRLACKCVYIHM